MEKIILVTGASSGIGLSTATLLARQGYIVFGTKLPTDPDLDDVPFHVIDLDVTDDSSVEQCIQNVIIQAGRIDVLVNNAGYNLYGAIEETSLEEARHQMEVNFFGMVKMAKAVLPAMRDRRDGQIINMSSFLGCIGTPFSGFYVASKHAVEGFTKSLRYELAPFNIHVSMIEPGFVRTHIRNHAHHSPTIISDYESMRRNIDRMAGLSMEHGYSPIDIAYTVQQIIKNPSPKLRYPVFIDPVSKFTALLPEPLTERTALMLMGVYKFRKDIQFFGYMAAVMVILSLPIAYLLSREE